MPYGVCSKHQTITIYKEMLFYQAERDRTLKDEQQQQEEALALQLEKTKLQELRDEKMRQQIRETR